MDWFEELTGFRETGYAGAQAQLRVEGDQLLSLVNGRSHGVGRFEMASLAELRTTERPAGAMRVGIVQGDVQHMHRDPDFAGALFQVASQFNMLEMVSPEVTPEDGVTRYAHDHTQGPACAIAAGAATIWRNYFAPVGGGTGQTAERQLDGLADMRAALSAALGVSPGTLWTMRNGYALASEAQLRLIGQHLVGLSPSARDVLQGKLRIGLHWDVEVTYAPPGERPRVSQAFCSALPIAYGAAPQVAWHPFAALVLEAAYEATLWAAARNARRGGSNIVLLTALGGGAFGNDARSIDDAIRRALVAFADTDLDVRLVSYGEPASWLQRVAADFA